MANMPVSQPKVWVEICVKANNWLSIRLHAAASPAVISASPYTISGKIRCKAGQVP